MTCRRLELATHMLALAAFIHATPHHATPADANSYQSATPTHHHPASHSRHNHTRHSTRPTAHGHSIYHTTHGTTAPPRSILGKVAAHGTAAPHISKVDANSHDAKSSHNQTGRAPSCGGCARRESALHSKLRLDHFSPSNLIGGTLALTALLTLLIVAGFKGWITRELVVTLAYGGLYMLASPTAIVLNKTLMKDIGFGYPVVVSALGQLATMAGASLAVRCCHVQTEAGRDVPARTLVLMGCASSTSLTFGQYPYLYLSVAFIQMLKAFSPAYLVLFLFLFGVETPSRRVVGIILAISACACVASAGEVHLHPIGLAFMAAASTSDTIRLVLAQKLLAQNQLGPVEALWYTSPYTIAWLLALALLTEARTIYQRGSIRLVWLHPAMFAGAALAGAAVNLTSFLLVKRTSSMTVKVLTMVRNAGLILFSALVLGEETTPLELVGYGGLLVCFVAFTVEKAR